jgi:hypothetical protein
MEVGSGIKEWKQRGFRDVLGTARYLCIVRIRTCTHLLHAYVLVKASERRKFKMQDVVSSKEGCFYQ